MTDWPNLPPQSRFYDAMKIATTVDTGKLRLLTMHICESLCTSLKKEVFSQEEEEKLTVSLKLRKDHLLLLLDGIFILYYTACRSMLEPSDLESGIKKNSSLSDDKINVIVNTYKTYSKKIIENWKKKSMYRLQVRDINWNLNIQASSSTSKDNILLAQLQLSLTGEKDSKMTIEMDENGLTKLHDNLEKIQNQLDSLK